MWISSGHLVDFFVLGWQQVFARDAEGDGEVGGDVDRRVGRDNDANDQRDGEAVHRRAAQDQQGGEHQQRGQVRDDRAQDRLVHREIDDIEDAAAALGDQVLADAVEDDDGFIVGVADQRQDGRQRCDVELDLEDRQEAQHHHRVVDQSRDCADRELPLEAEHDVRSDAHEREQQRQAARAEQLLADLRADELDAAQCDVVVLGVQRLEHMRADLRRVLAAGRRQPDQDRGRGTEVLHDGAFVPRFSQIMADLVEFDALRVRDLHQHAAGEVDAEVQTTEDNQQDGSDRQDRRHHQAHLALGHEVDFGDAGKEFHEFGLSVANPGATFSLDRTAPPH